MGSSAGRIDLDLNLNQRGFNQQMRGIQGLAKKAGALIAGAFAVKGLFDAVKLGSDLNEVQNVVDVTFTSMSAQVNQFAQDAAQSFGLSETMAKKYMGTFGAMSKAFGFSEQEAYKMSTALTGLSGDVASFYNISQDEAYTKLKSVFTGETETLKDLGIVMTQNALDAYAMANGYGKTTAAMSEAEKVALRFAFVQNQLSLANGDFARTSDSWANQVRILKLQMESFMATVGQGLINIFTPAIKVINLLMGKLIALANLFKAFTEAITGKKSSASSGMKQTAEAAGMVAGGVTGAGNAAAGAAKKTKKAAKEIQKSLAGFDELTTLTKNSDSGDDTGGGDAGGVGGGISAVDTGIDFGVGTDVSPDVNAAAEKVKLVFAGVKSWYEENFASIFKRIGKDIKPEIDELKITLGGIWSDIGTLGTPLKAWFLNDFTPFLQQTVITMGEIIVGLFDSFNKVFSDIWNLAVYPILQNFLTVGLPLLTQFWTEIIATLGVLFGEVKQAFDLIWAEAVAPALSMITQIWIGMWNTLKGAWEEWGGPIFEGIRTAVQNTGELIRQIWDTVLKPVWDSFMQTVDWLWNDHLQPLVANFLGLVGDFASGALQIYNQCIAPLISWFVEHLGPAIAVVFQFIVDVVGSKIAFFIDKINSFITILRGLIQFITGIFTGDWKKAWAGVVTVFKGVFQGIATVVKGILNPIIDVMNALIRGIVSGLNFVIKKVNGISIDVPSWIPGIGGKKFGPNINPITSYQIPKLATGAVIPPNSEFMAMLGDQKNGRNLEAPESLIRKIVQEESGNVEIAGLLRRLIDLTAQGMVMVADGKTIAQVVNKEQAAGYRTAGKTLIPI